MIEHAAIDEEALPAFEQFRNAFRQVLRLFDEWRHDQQADKSQHADDDEIDEEDGQPARQALCAWRSSVLDDVDQWAQAGGQQTADVDDKDRAACDVESCKCRSRERDRDDRAADRGRRHRRKSVVYAAIKRYTSVSSSGDARNTIRR